MSAAKACVLVFLVAACAGSSDGDVSASSSTAVTGAQVTTTTGDGAATTVPESGDIPQLSRYLATIEHGLEGTGLEGAAFEEPESLIRTGVLFCELLDEGFGPIDVLRGWVAALATDGHTPSEDDLLLGGVVLGSAVKFLCPEYLGDLELARSGTGL
jgi:hypothetical protein